MMTPTNDPVAALLSTMRGGGNTMALMQQMAAQVPQVNMVMKMMQGKTPQQLEHLARNMAKERGTTVEDLARSMGLQFPGNR